MSVSTEKRGFFRRKSSGVAITCALILATLLFTLLLSLYFARSALTLFEKKNVTESVSVILDSEVVHDGLADTIQQLAPENTITKEQINTALESPEVQEAIGQFGDELITDFLDTENTEVDPVETFLNALNNPEQAEIYDEALEIAMREAGVSDEDFYNAATLLADELGVEPPAKDSTNMEIATDMLQKNAEKLATNIEPITQITTSSETKFVFTVADTVRTWFDTLHFVLVNAIVLLLFYGILLLFLRHLWKPFLCIGIPYLFVGAILMFVRSLDITSWFELPAFISSLIGAFMAAVYRNGMTALIVGGTLVVAFIVLMIVQTVLRKRKEKLGTPEPDETLPEPTV